MKHHRSMVCAIFAASFLFLLTSPSPVFSSPSTGYTVNSILDTDDGSCDVSNCTLREAIHAANSSPASITFDLTYPATITLSSALPGITAGYSVTGPADGELTLDGNGAATVFSVQADNATLENLSVTGATTGIELSADLLNVENCTIYDNGTGILINRYSYMSISNSIISGNTGVGLLEYGWCDVQDYTCDTYANITNSTFTANDGGGIHSVGAIDISNSTLQGNTSPVSGGGILAEGATTISFTTISGNTSSSGSGGGVSFSWMDPGAFMMSWSIISDNQAPTDENCSVPVFMISNSLQYPGTSCGTSTPTADPLLLPLADNGGPTPTMALRLGSPAIDALSICGLSLDQRGYPRFIDGNRDGVAACDIGAFEASFLYRFLPFTLKSP